MAPGLPRPIRTGRPGRPSRTTYQPDSDSAALALSAMARPATAHPLSTGPGAAGSPVLEGEKRPSRLPYPSALSGHPARLLLRRREGAEAAHSETNNARDRRQPRSLPLCGLDVEEGARLPGSRRRHGGEGKD